MNSCDAIVIGAGHNGLVCASLLAKSGKRVLLLEAFSEVGGLAASREFSPGFKASPVHSVNNFSASVVKQLDLTRHGLTFLSPMPTIGLSADGAHVSLLGDQISGIGAKDADTYPRYRQQLLKYAQTLSMLWEKNMPRLGGDLRDALVYAQAGLKMRLLGAEDMGELVRILALPMRDLVSENFDNPILKAMLCWDGLIGNKMAPRSPNNAVLPLMLRMSGAGEGDYLVPKGGASALVAALLNAAREVGVDIRTNAAVENIVIEPDPDGMRAVGVKLRDGMEIRAPLIVSSADPKTTFLNLIGAENLEIQFANRIKRLRTNGFVAKLHLALSQVPKFTGLDTLEGRLIIAPDVDAIEFAYDDAKYGKAAENPVIEVTIPSLHDPSLAPAGQHVLSAHVLYAPRDEITSWSDDARQKFEARIIETISKYVPAIREITIGSELLTPLDLERDYLVTGGHWHHGELALEQMMMMRPTYGAAQYSTPIPGMFLCGAGSHPGGGIMGAAALNAARQILK